ncbi:permease [Streptomyces sp. ODS28]|uniref:permease n=1 Tax=Streptomyces sp. ODS28 TaxID=3136688 RepID=UPI0031E8A11D
MSTAAEQAPPASAPVSAPPPASPPSERRGGRLTWHLLRIGLAAGRGTPGDRLRRWALCAAAAAVALVALAAVAAVATYEGRADRAAARGPLLGDQPRGAVALWRESFDAVGEVPHTVVYLQPLAPDAAPPPGLTRWPAPGEAVLSPELVRRGGQEQITGRYGRFAGTIGEEGLVSPSERLVYARPAHAPGAAERREAWSYVRGFGHPYPMGEILYARPLPQVLLGLGALAGVPALALLVVAARVGSRTRDRRSALLDALGGTRRHRALVNVGEAALPAALGTALAALPWCAVSLLDLRLPPTGYVLNGADLRAAWPLAAGALAASFAVTPAAVVLLHRTARRQRGGETHGAGSPLARIPRWRPVGCAAGVAVVAFSQYLRGTPGLLAFVLGTVVMWALLPSVAALAARRTGAAIAARGLRSGRPGPLIGGRWTVAHPGVVVRLATAAVIALGLISQLQVWNSRLGEQAAAARATRAVAGDTVLDVRSREFTPGKITALSRSLPAHSRVLALNTNSDQGTALLQGSCATLRSLSLGCPTTPRAVQDRGRDARVREIRRWYGPELRVQAVGAPLRLDRLRGSLLVLAPPGNGPRVERAAYAVAPGVNVETLGETWLTGAVDKERLNNWLLLFGSSGLALLLLAGSIGAAAEFVRMRRALAPLAVLTGSREVFRSVALWHLTVPLLIASAVAAVVTAWHSVFFVSVVQQGGFSSGVLAAALCGCAVAAVAVGVLGGRSAARAAREWRPTAD